MHKTILTAAAALIACSAFASNPVLDSPYNKTHFGIRASFDLSDPGKMKADDTKIDMLSPSPGASIGLICNIPIVYNFYIEPGLDLYYNTFSLNTGKLSESLPASADIINHHSLRKFGMRIPVQLGYHFSFVNLCSFSVYTGPVVDIGFANDYYITSKEVAGQKLHMAGSVYNDNNPVVALHRADCKWRIGVGLTIQDIYIGLSGDIGLTNMLKKDLNGNLSYHENAFHFTLGYNF